MSLTRNIQAAPAQASLRIELGRTWLTPRDATALAPGSMIELDASVAGEVDVRRGAVPLGRGEPVMMDGKFGVRITRLAAGPDELREA